MQVLLTKFFLITISMLLPTIGPLDFGWAVRDLEN